MAVKLRPGKGHTCPFDGAKLKAGREYPNGSRRGKKVWQCPKCHAVF